MTDHERRIRKQENKESIRQLAIQAGDTTYAVVDALADAMVTIEILERELAQVKRGLRSWALMSEEDRAGWFDPEVDELADEHS